MHQPNLQLCLQLNAMGPESNYSPPNSTPSFHMLQILPLKDGNFQEHSQSVSVSDDEDILTCVVNLFKPTNSIVPKFVPKPLRNSKMSDKELPSSSLPKGVPTNAEDPSPVLLLLLKIYRSIHPRKSRFKISLLVVLLLKVK